MCSKAAIILLLVGAVAFYTQNVSPTLFPTGFYRDSTGVVQNPVGKRVRNFCRMVPTEYFRSDCTSARKCIFNFNKFSICYNLGWRRLWRNSSSSLSHPLRKTRFGVHLATWLLWMRAVWSQRLHGPEFRQSKYGPEFRQSKYGIEYFESISC